MEEPRALLELRDVWLRYPIQLIRERSIKNLLLGQALRRREYRGLWGLRGIDLQIQPGETLGVLGRNGAGKSTLLKIMAGILEPDRGQLTVRGRIGALLGLNVGFQPEMTGRENIFISTALLGVPAREIRRVAQDIAASAGLGEFIDVQVRAYSTGMKSRLGLAIAARLKFDVLVMDEILSAGDLQFRQCAQELMAQIRQSSGAVVVASHNIKTLTDFCQRAIWLERGALVMCGPVREVVETYEYAAAHAPTRQTDEAFI